MNSRFFIQDFILLIWIQVFYLNLRFWFEFTFWIHDLISIHSTFWIRGFIQSWISDDFLDLRSYSSWISDDFWIHDIHCIMHSALMLFQFSFDRRMDNWFVSFSFVRNHKEDSFFIGFYFQFIFYWTVVMSYLIGTFVSILFISRCRLQFIDKTF